MATKTQAEATKDTVPQPGNGNTAIIQRTDERMTFRLVSEDNAALPAVFAGLLSEGFTTQRHVKLAAGDYVQGTFRGMHEGELAERIDRTTGEAVTPKIKWIYIEQESGVVIRLLGAYNLIAQLDRAQDGDLLRIARGSDYNIPGGFRCTDYLVFVKPMHPVSGAAGAVVSVPSRTV